MTAASLLSFSSPYDKTQAVATSLFLTGLLNARLVLEDPFIPDLSNPDIVPVERVRPEDAAPPRGAVVATLG